MAKTTYQIPIKYHFAHVRQLGEIKSTIEIIDESTGVVKIHGESPVGKDAMVKFGAISAASFTDVKSNHYYASNIGYHCLEVDLYSGTVAHNYSSNRIGGSPTISYATKYTPQTGYRIIKSPPDFPSSLDNDKAKPMTDFGYIEESPPRLMSLILKRAALVKSMQEGLINLKLNIFDTVGYVMQLFPSFLLDMTEAAQRVELGKFISDSPTTEEKQLVEVMGEATIDKALSVDLPNID